MPCGHRLPAAAATGTAGDAAAVVAASMRRVLQRVQLRRPPVLELQRLRRRLPSLRLVRCAQAPTEQSLTCTPRASCTRTCRRASRSE